MTRESRLRVFSYGGGRQSTAVLVLCAQGRLAYNHLLFANVGDDTENPATLAYMAEYAKPYAAEHGVDLVELRRTMRDGSTRTLTEELINQPSSIPIPVRLASGGFGRRRCTDRFKIQVVARWTKAHGASPDAPAICGIGISTDEIGRASTVERVEWQRTEYPLLDLGLSKGDCQRIVAEAGLPPAPKSSCSMCPFRSLEDRRRQRREQPEAFADSVALERMVNERRDAMGKDHVWFSGLMRPLDQLPDQLGLFGDEDETTCDTFSCFT